MAFGDKSLRKAVEYRGQAVTFLLDGLHDQIMNFPPMCVSKILLR